MANDRTRTLSQLTSVEGQGEGFTNQDYTFLSWPPELGAVVSEGYDTGIRYPHVCAFFINENVKDQLASTSDNLSRGGTTSSVLGSRAVNGTTNNVVTNRISNSGFSTTSKGLTVAGADAVASGINAGTGAVADATNAVTSGVSLATSLFTFGTVNLPKTNLTGTDIKHLVAPVYKRLKLAIFLPMPREVKHEYGVMYNEAAMEGMFGTALTALNNEGVKSAVTNGLEAGVRGVMSKLVEGGASFLNMGDSGKQIFNKTLGTVDNPRTEQVFEKVSVREFTFQWNFFPKTEAESLELRTILDLFKENMLPSFRSDDSVGGFYTMPNEFDIEFYTSDMGFDEKGNTTEQFFENIHIPRISTCVLTSMLIDSTPRGQFAAFKGTGAPINIAVTMTFKELSPLHRGMVGDGIKIGSTRSGGH